MNEATLLGIEVDPIRLLAAVTLSVLTLPSDEGPPPLDPRVQMRLSPVGRLLVYYRKPTAGRPKSVPLNDLLSVVQSFGGSAIYGWEFFDRPSGPAETGPASLDLEFGRSGRSHNVLLFQEAGTFADLSVRIWFDNV